LELFEARFDRDLFKVWTGLRSDHVLKALRDLDQARVIVPRIWMDGVYQIYGRTEGWKAKPFSSVEQAEAADAAMVMTNADRRVDLAADAGEQFNATIAAGETLANLADAVDIARPGGECSSPAAKQERSDGQS
jgi:hypothetical protein